VALFTGGLAGGRLGERGLIPQYLAGLIDGEGSIYMWRVRMAPRVAICMDSSASMLIEQVNAEYGGILARDTRKRGNSVISVKWNALDEIEDLLTKIVPYLILKREQAKLVLWWLPLRDRYRNRVLTIDEELTLMKRNPSRTVGQAVARINLPRLPTNVTPIRSDING
jgi:hypothetical protein